MIEITTGDILQSKADALVNTVNTQGIMGKGIALRFKEAFPNNFKVYVENCKKGLLEPGKILAVWDNNITLGRKLIINFPTKKNWRNPSRYEYIEKGLKALREFLDKEKIKSVAIPPLGCGQGGLDWEKVKEIIEAELNGLQTHVYLYAPNPNIKDILQESQAHHHVELTPARAALLYCLFSFERLGENSSLFTANKLAYFLQRKGFAMRLRFQPHHYGPYAVGVEKLLYRLNGVYITGLEQGSIKPFEPLKLNYNKWNEVEYYVFHRLKNEDMLKVTSLMNFLNDFKSELSLEILSTVDFILYQNPSSSLSDVTKAIGNWNLRKKNLFLPEYIEKAYYHLKSDSEIFVTNI